MRKIDLLKRSAKVDDKILALYNSGRKIHPEKLTCKDLKRLNEAFDKCMVEEKK